MDGQGSQLDRFVAFLEREGANIGRRAQYGLTAATLLLAFAPVLMPFLSRSAAKATELRLAEQFYCVVNNNALRAAPGPYGYDYALYDRDKEHYFALLRFLAAGEKPFQDEIKSQSLVEGSAEYHEALDRYFAQTYLPANRLYDTRSVFQKITEAIPGYRPAHEAVESFLQKRLGVGTSDSASLAHAVLALSLIAAQGLARGMRHRRHSHQKDEAVTLLSDRERFMQKIAHGLPELLDNPVISVVPWLAIAASVAPAAGTGAVYLAEMAGQGSLAASIAQVAGIGGHTLNLVEAGDVLGVLTAGLGTMVSPHALTCLLPSAGPAAGELLRRFQQIGERMGRGG